MMNFESEQLLPGVWHIGLHNFTDKRGNFVKTFSRNAYLDHGLDVTWREEFYSISSKNVIRGMHFQTPPSDHVKMVFCAIGKVLDVLLDLRNAPGYGSVAYRNLDSSVPSVLVIL